MFKWNYIPNLYIIFSLAICILYVLAFSTMAYFGKICCRTRDLVAPLCTNSTFSEELVFYSFRDISPCICSCISLVGEGRKTDGGVALHTSPSWIYWPKWMFVHRPWYWNSSAICRLGYTVSYTSDPRDSASAICQYIFQCIAMLHRMALEEADFSLT